MLLHHQVERDSKLKCDREFFSSKFNLRSTCWGVLQHDTESLWAPGRCTLTSDLSMKGVGRKEEACSDIQTTRLSSLSVLHSMSPLVMKPLTLNKLIILALRKGGKRISSRQNGKGLTLSESKWNGLDDLYARDEQLDTTLVSLS